MWFGPEERPLFGWVSRPADGLARGGAVLCPPMGEEGRAAHRTFRRLAQALAEAGIVALRFDYDGTGDSAGLQDEPGRVAAWLDSVEAARQHLLDLGVPSVAAVGMRLGATLAGARAAEAPFSALVCWDPCVSGRTWLREGEALYGFGENATLEPPDDGLRHTPGFQYDTETATALRSVDLGKLPADRRLADRVLLLTRDDRPSVPALLERLGLETLETAAAGGQGQLLDVPPELSVVPQDALRRVVAFLAEQVAGQEAVPVKAPDAERAVVVGSEPDAAVPVRERLTRLGPDGIVGLADEPLEPTGREPWVVLVNVAAEHHIGPGRRWVEWARRWAARGYRVVRIDQSGVGDSPTLPGQADDRPFAPEWIDDMRHVVSALRTDGVPVALVGLCSGSYSAFEVAMWEHVDGIFAMNPRLTLYPAAKGTPVYTDRRRAAMLPNRPFARLAETHRILAGGLWRIYRELAVWHAPLLVPWRVLRRRTPVEIVACPDDAQHFTEVYALRPLFWWMRRRFGFRFESREDFDHSLLTRRAQLVGYERATEFLDRTLSKTP
ncbi:alpha/beta hydrolase [Nocardioides anomalus]|uniref:Alpha/beta hydrolase n=1 Tax=Nocardioides anomalus TaxID=2712223 RepID=A0A6G6WA22_9ACTN|nr:alpha/beta fold hydrolase [Nocardioides anomalus]QIG42188.1 alpha/beta hydrolase [Nocardioides anomalus]